MTIYFGLWKLSTWLAHDVLYAQFSLPDSDVMSYISSSILSLLLTVTNTAWAPSLLGPSRGDDSAEFHVQTDLPAFKVNVSASRACNSPATAGQNYPQAPQSFSISLLLIKPVIDKFKRIIGPEPWLIEIAAPVGRDTDRLFFSDPHL